MQLENGKNHMIKNKNTPGWIQTNDLRFRKTLLYSPELRGQHIQFYKELLAMSIECGYNFS